MSKKQPTNAEVIAAMPTLCPHYHHATTLIAEVGAWSEAGFPGASLEDVIRIAKDFQPELMLGEIRRRAERNVNKIFGLPIRRERRPMALRGRLPGWRLKRR